MDQQTNIDTDQSDEEILTYTFSDEDLERANTEWNGPCVSATATWVPFGVCSFCT